MKKQKYRKRFSDERNTWLQSKKIKCVSKKKDRVKVVKGLKRKEETIGKR